MKKQTGRGSFGGSITFGAAPDGPITEEEARDVVGPALLSIAEKHKVGEIRKLTKQIVYDEIKETGKSHPLYEHVFHCSPVEAAERYFIDRCLVLIKSVVIVPLTIRQSHRERAFVPASEVLQHASGGGFTRRPAHVLREDALKHDVEYQSVLGGALRRLFIAFNYVEAWCSQRKQTSDVAELLATIRGAIDEYKSSIRRDAAE